MVVYSTITGKQNNGSRRALIKVARVWYQAWHHAATPEIKNGEAASRNPVDSSLFMSSNHNKTPTALIHVFFTAMFLVGRKYKDQSSRKNKDQSSRNC
jgi:hypothetical protein